MLLAEIDPFLVCIPYAHLAGIIPCMAVVLILIGCAFRFHANESQLPWNFTGCVVVWMVFHPVSLDLAWSFVVDRTHELDAYALDARSRLLCVGAGLTTAVYVWLFCCRKGPDSFQRLAFTLLLSGFLSCGISWMTGTIGCDGYNQGVLPGVTFFDYHELKQAIPLLDRLNVDSVPSWGEGVGWVIWYIGLFTGKRQIRQPD